MVLRYNHSTITHAESYMNGRKCFWQFGPIAMKRVEANYDWCGFYFQSLRK